MYTGLFVWLEQLHRGVASLPETLPESTIRAWHKGHPAEEHPAVGFTECTPDRRCEGCRFVLPSGLRPRRL
jgi:hypothetical protein